jgi:uncharacterized membrane protein
VRKRRLLLLSGTCLVAALTVVTASISVPQAVRTALGLPIVLVLPGFAMLSAVLPRPQLSLIERCLASVGASLAMTTCAGVLLGAAPMGLSRESLALTLGLTTIAASVYAGIRMSRVDEA